ncbi:hypothetical protein AUJ14_02905 [Candidatus Micrarchaeota archaeon CG1_02_55_22]|nr:MAG: hypothetical protein AUJ14_02905 [Candidatus Micrarchaeota archaeon CG1_02_55_22]
MTSIGKNQRVSASVSFQCKNLSIGDNCVIHDRVTFLGDEITIGDNVWIGQDAVLDGTGGLVIDDNVTIGIRACIFTHAGTKGFMLKKAPVKIGDYAWLMSGVTVNPGVKIGRDARVLNNALVTKDVDEASVASGAPAVVTGRVPEKERLSRVLKPQQS